MSFAERYNYDDRPVKVRMCDQPGCAHAGEHRAPKDRELREYYWFCLEHVRAYNKAWDYFAGMGPGAIEAHIRNATVWERPTWPLGNWQARQEDLLNKVHAEFFGGEAPFTAPPSAAMSVAERDALAMLDLRAPITFEQIKAQYRVLVKRHHPDANGGSADAEERFKSINQAFAVLKQIYETETTN